MASVITVTIAQIGMLLGLLYALYKTKLISDWKNLLGSRKVKRSRTTSTVLEFDEFPENSTNFRRFYETQKLVNYLFRFCLGITMILILMYIIKLGKFEPVPNVDNDLRSQKTS